MLLRRRHAEGVTARVGSWVATEYELSNLRFEARVVRLGGRVGVI